jgi:tetratricopeptide (TPR) repeat protein
MEGPFGAGTIFGPRAPGRIFIRASLAAKTTRIGQLLDALLGLLVHDSSTARSWKGLEMFQASQTRHDEPGRQRVYEHFRNNLEDIVRLGRKAGVKIILSTAASNLKDCPPFASLHSMQLSGTQKNAWDQLYQEGRTLELSGKFSEAIDRYSRAAQLDREYAELQYRLGGCYLALTNLAQARHCFELSRDFDALPFRADSRINEIIENVATDYRDQGVYQLSAASVLSSESSPRMPGHESFYEHVHLSFDGNYLLAHALAEQVARLLPATMARDDKGEWASPEHCARRLALTAWNRYRVYESVLRRVSEKPFTEQLNALTRQDMYREKLVRLKARMNAAALEPARVTYQEALANAPDDFFLHQKFAELLEMAGDLTGALSEWQRVRELLPHHPIVQFQFGRLLARLGKASEAQASLTLAVTIRPDFVEALDELGQALSKQRKFEEGIARYHQALRLQPDNAAIHFHLADALAAHGRRPEALVSLREAIRLRPAFWEARYLLGVELALQGKIQEAQDQFAEVVRLRPDYALGHLNLGVALVNQGRIDDARAQFLEALRLDPKNKLAREHLETIQLLKSRGR